MLRMYILTLKHVLTRGQIYSCYCVTYILRSKILCSNIIVVPLFIQSGRNLRTKMEITRHKSKLITSIKHACLHVAPSIISIRIKKMLGMYTLTLKYVSTNALSKIQLT